MTYGKNSMRSTNRFLGRWDDNLIDMCIGEKRVLTIPPEFGYGDRAMGPIPAKSTLSMYYISFNDSLSSCHSFEFSSPNVSSFKCLFIQISLHSNILISQLPQTSSKTILTFSPASSLRDRTHGY